MSETDSPSVDYDLLDAEDIDRELARINLLRIRGRYEEARTACLKVLNDHPKSAAAHTLMGDICVDRDDLPQAAEWYELALDIIPESEADQQKLDQVRRRIADREAASTAELLGLPTTRPKVGLLAAGAVGFLVLVALISFLIGRSLQREPTGPLVIDSPIMISETEPRMVDRPDADAPAVETPRLPTPSRVETDRALLGNLVPGAPEGVSLIEAFKDPRTRHIYVTVEVPDGMSLPDVAARIGAHCLQVVQTALVVTTRLIVDGRIAYLADVTRAAVVATSDQAWRDRYGDVPGAWTRAVLSNEWPPVEEDGGNVSAGPGYDPN